MHILNSNRYSFFQRAEKAELELVSLGARLKSNQCELDNMAHDLHALSGRAHSADTVFCISPPIKYLYD